MSEMCVHTWWKELPHILKGSFPVDKYAQHVYSPTTTATNKCSCVWCAIHIVTLPHSLNVVA